MVLNPDKLRIVADQREKKSGIPDLLRSIDLPHYLDLQVDVKTLPTGDYIVGPETVVERKTIQDLMSSIFDGRLKEQCSRLKEQFKHPVILMEGNVDEIENLTENLLVFYGAVSKVALDYGIPIIPTPNAKHTARLLLSLCKQKESAHGPFIKKTKKSTDVQQQQLSLLASLPGVGEKLAIRMLERFGTPTRALTAPVSDLAKVEGLGEKRAQKIKKMLDSKSRRRKTTGQKTLYGPS